MGTISSSLTPTTNTFNGNSQYAADLQQAINHAVDIASIPLNQLQTNISALQVQSTETTALQNEFASLQTAVQNLSSSGGTLAGNVFDNTIASVSVNSSSTATPGTYQLNVINAGSPTTTISKNNLSVVSDPSSTSLSSSSAFTLTVGSSTVNITPSSNSLNALAQSINSANAGVTATIINIGPPGAGDYRLSLQSTSLGNVGIQLNDGSNNLLNVLTTGQDAQYQVDGQPSTSISSTSSTVTLAPGVTVNLLQAGETTVTVAPDSSAAANALSAFASAYNAAATELNFNHGTSGGALTGQSIVSQLSQSLRDLLQYSGGNGSVHGLSDLGLTFNSTGQLNFNQGTFDAVSATNPNDVASFLGSASGGGFLGNATSLLNGLEDLNNGVFATTQSSFQRQINADNQEANDTANRIVTMRNNMVAQMTQADTLIASLESQVNYFTMLFADTQNAIKANG